MSVFLDSFILYGSDSWWSLWFRRFVPFLHCHKWQLVHRFFATNRKLCHDAGLACRLHQGNLMSLWEIVYYHRFLRWDFVILSWHHRFMHGGSCIIYFIRRVYRDDIAMLCFQDIINHKLRWPCLREWEKYIIVIMLANGALCMLDSQHTPDASGILATRQKSFQKHS